MKAHHGGPVIGKALGFFAGSSASDKGSVLVLIAPGDQRPQHSRLPTER